MNSFEIYTDGRQAKNLFDRSRKGVVLLQYLILNRGQVVGRQKLLDAFWEDDSSANPESALKTLISRMRTQLKQMCDSDGVFIVAEQGGYRWQPLDNMTIDVYEIEDILDQLNDADEAEVDRRCTRLLQLYRGDLLAQNAESQIEWIIARGAALHGRFRAAVYAYVELLKKRGNYTRIIEVCRTALDVDSFDDRLHMELMNALIESDRMNEAVVEYKHVIHLYYRYLGVTPSQEMRDFYDHIARSRQSVEFSLKAIVDELIEGDEKRGAFVCEYAVFKEVFHLQMRSLERTGTPVFLAVIMVEGVGDKILDSIEQDNIMIGLRDILQVNLRRGDTITRFSPTMFALLLPTVTFITGNRVMERIKQIFYRKYPNSDISYRYLIGPLNDAAGIRLGEDMEPGASSANRPSIRMGDLWPQIRKLIDK